MIIGAHIMIQSRNDKADKAFLSEVLKLPHVDAGNGFLIFGVPGEIAIHDSERNDVHQLWLMVEDLDAFLAEMKKRNIAYALPANRGWGTVTHIVLPGGGRMQVYKPHHKRPHAAAAKAAPAKAAKAAKPAPKKAAAKKPAKAKKAKRR